MVQKLKVGQSYRPLVDLVELLVKMEMGQPLRLRMRNLPSLKAVQRPKKWLFQIPFETQNLWLGRCLFDWDVESRRQERT